MNTKPFPPLCDPVLVLDGEGGDVGIFSRTKDQPTASLMHSLCAACSWRQPLSSGAAPWYYIRFPREHTLIVGLLGITEPEISSFSRGDSVTKAGHPIFVSLSTVNRNAYSVQTTASAGTSAVVRPEGRWIDGKMKASPSWLQVLSLNSFSVLQRALAPLLCSNWQIGEQHHKLPSETWNWQFKQIQVRCHRSGAGTGWHRQSVKMWNKLACANRDGCYWVACCSLLRSNNKIRDKSIGGSGGKEAVSGSDWQTWPRPLDESGCFKYVSSRLIPRLWSVNAALLCILSEFTQAWSASTALCGLCSTSHVMSWRVSLPDLCPAPQLWHTYCTVSNQHKALFPYCTRSLSQQRVIQILVNDSTVAGHCVCSLSSLDTF